MADMSESREGDQEAEGWSKRDDYSKILTEETPRKEKECMAKSGDSSQQAQAFRVQSRRREDKLKDFIEKYDLRLKLEMITVVMTMRNNSRLSDMRAMLGRNLCKGNTAVRENELQAANGRGPIGASELAGRHKGEMRNRSQNLSESDPDLKEFLKYEEEMNSSHLNSSHFFDQSSRQSQRDHNSLSGTQGLQHTNRKSETSASKVEKPKKKLGDGKDKEPGSTAKIPKGKSNKNSES